MSRKFVPEDDKALKKLVRETAKAAGADDLTTPHRRTRARLKAQAAGEIDVDEYVKRQKADQKKRR
ncbi:MAG: hypothetical protein ABL957_03810 [Parvularculaceae bacterium]